MPDNSLEITVSSGTPKQDPVIDTTAKLAKPTAKGLPQWVQEKLADDAVELYSDFKDAIKTHLKPRFNKEGEQVMPNVNVMGMVADILKMREQGGISINQNFGGNTTIHNNTSVSFEDLVRRQQTRDKPVDIVDAEIIEPDEKK